eukprot:12530686-Heterocapsa_arctica.AAC.1
MTRPNASGGTTLTKLRSPKPSKGNLRMTQMSLRPQEVAHAEEGTRRMNPRPLERKSPLQVPREAQPLVLPARQSRPRSSG